MSVPNLVQALAEKRVSPAALTARMRRKVVQLFMEERSEVSTRYISELIGISQPQVSRIRAKLLRDSAWEIDSLDIKALAVELKKRKEELWRRAVQAGDYALAWRVHMDYLEKMQELGYVPKAPEKHLVGTMEVGNQLGEFFQLFGVPSLPEFMQLLKEVASTSGRLPVPIVHPQQAGPVVEAVALPPGPPQPTAAGPRRRAKARTEQEGKRQ